MVEDVQAGGRGQRRRCTSTAAAAAWSRAADEILDAVHDATWPGGEPDGEGLREARPSPSTTSFERKSGPADEATHYCPGCGHGNVHKMIAEAHRGAGDPRAHGLRQPGRLLGLRLLLLRLRQRPGGPRPRARRGHRHQARQSRHASSSPTRATATWRPSAPPRPSTRPTAARTSPCSSSTTPSTA